MNRTTLLAMIVTCLWLSAGCGQPSQKPVASKSSKSKSKNKTKTPAQVEKERKESIRKLNETRASLRSLINTIRLYMVENNTTDYPKSLKVLMAKKDAEGNPQLPKFDRYPADAWGNKIQYAPPPPNAPLGTTPKIWSFGPNQKDENGAGDDITYQRPVQ